MKITSKFFLYGAIVTTVHLILTTVMLDHFKSTYDANVNTIQLLTVLLVVVFYLGGLLHYLGKLIEDW